MKPPKSTGREQFGEAFVTELLNRFKKHSKENILATVTMFTACSIVHHYKAFILPYYEIDEVILGGGGSYNNTLVEMLRNGLEKRNVAYVYKKILVILQQRKKQLHLLF